MSTIDPVTIYADEHISTLSGLPTIQGYEFTGSGSESIALGAQTDPIERGVYDVPLGGGPWTRRADFSPSTPPPLFAEFRVIRGAYARWKFYVENQSVPTPGTAEVYFQALDRGSPETSGPGLDRSGTQLRLPVQSLLDGGGMFYGVELSDRGIGIDGDNSHMELHIAGLTAQVPSAALIDVYPGSAFIPGHGDIVVQGTFETISPTFEDMGAGSFVAGTLYHLYVTHFGQRFSPYYILSPTAPVSESSGSPVYVKGPSGAPEPTKRYIQSFLADSSSSLRKHRAHSKGNSCEVRYLADAGAAPFVVLPGGAATSETPVSCASVVPPTAYSVRLRVVTNGSAAVAFGNSEDGITLSDTVFLERIRISASVEIELPLDSNRAFTYRNSASGGATDISVLGYEEAR